MSKRLKYAGTCGITVCKKVVDEMKILKHPALHFLDQESSNLRRLPHFGRCVIRYSNGLIKQNIDGIRVKTHMTYLCFEVNETIFQMRFYKLATRLYPSFLIAFTSCIVPYEPRVRENVSDILVVEGFINATSRTASVKLSHTLNISDRHDPAPELNARVSISTSSGSTYLFEALDSGKYAAKELAIDEHTRYVLHINTLSGREYISDPISIKKTPPIDSLTWGISSDGKSVITYVSTHDPLSGARYYRWDYTETYEYHAAYYSGLQFKNGLLKYRKPEDQVYTCWLTIPAGSIAIGSSAGLTKDIIAHRPITYLPYGTPKLSVRYSVLVKQMAISEAEYEYLTQLKNTTEGLGGIFGTLPSSVTGNIHLVGDSRVPVLGYFSGAEIREQRLFIDRDQLPDYLKVAPNKRLCELKQTCQLSPPTPQFGDPPSCVPREIVGADAIPISAEHEEYPIVPFFYFTSSDCGDCRTLGGINKKPPFW